VPKIVDREKRLARRAYREREGFKNRVAMFLEFLNTGHAECPKTSVHQFASFDRDSHEPARQLWELCNQVAQEMLAEGQRGSAKTPFDVNYILRLKQRFERIEPAAKDQMGNFFWPGTFGRTLFCFAGSVSSMLYQSPSQRRYPVGAPFRCIARCLNESCHRWFFALDDRHIYCTPGCRQSRQPEKRNAAVALHRARKRL
jgi:hypothetical protein